MKKLIFTLLIGVVVFNACKKDRKTQLEKDTEKIREYLEENNLEAQKTASGLYYIIEKQGTGKRPSDTSRVTVEYIGKLLNGKVFDEGLETFPLNGLIEGWQEGLKLFKQGGRGKLFIPSTLGYGDRETGPIPPNSVLIFEVDLIYVE